MSEFNPLEPSELEELEQKYISEMVGRCTSSDLGRNGVEFDRVVRELLDELGFDRLSATLGNIRCWRS